MSYAESLHAAQLAGLNAAFGQSLIPRELRPREDESRWEDESRREEDAEPPPDGAAASPRRIRCAHTFDLARPGCRACSGRPGTPCGSYEPAALTI